MAAYSNFTLTSDGMEFFLDLLQGGGEMEFRCQVSIWPEDVRKTARMHGVMLL